MKVRFGQIFYGAGARGYAVLAASLMAKGCEDEASALCGMIGTPRMEAAGPFVLASRPFGRRVLLARACEGERDSIGRRTLFFHVLVAAAADLEESGLDAFALAEKGAFLSSLPEGAAEDADIESSSPAAAPPPPPFPVSFPATLRLEKADVALVRSILGSRANAMSWTTFAGVAHPSFDLCAVDVYSALPARTSIYDGKGLVQSASPSRRRPAESPPASEGEKPGKGCAAFVLKASLALNVALGALAAALFLGRGDGDSARGRVEAAAPAPEQAKVEAKAADDGTAEMMDAIGRFSREDVIRDWDDVVAQSTYLSRMKTPKPGKELDKKIFDRISANVRFVKLLFDIESKRSKTE